MRILIPIIVLMALASPTWAACTSPAGVAGEIIYNADWRTMQFCDDTDWISMGSSAPLETDMPAKTLKGNNTNAAGPALDLTVTQLMNMIIPTGAIWAFDLSACPTGWAEYTPARGRFLRGIDPTGTIDAGGTRTAGNLQADSIIEHTHGGVHDTSDFYTGPSANRPLVSSSGTRHQIAMDSTALTASKRATNMAGASIGAVETRPKNVAVLFCRKS